MHVLWQYPHTVSRADMLYPVTLETGGVWSSERDFQLVKFYPVSLNVLGDGGGVFRRLSTLLFRNQGV